MDLLSQQNKKIMTPIELHAKKYTWTPLPPPLKIYMDPTPPPPTHTHTHCLYVSKQADVIAEGTNFPGGG